MKSTREKSAAKSGSSAPESHTAASESGLAAADLVNATHPLTEMDTRFATKENSRFVPGRREWLQYLDAGVAEASGGRMRVTLSASNGAMTQETGWHYHECEMQLGYIKQGWIELQYEDGTEIRLEAGDVMFVPGGVKHNEVRTSADLAGLEVTIPANMGTVRCERPKDWKPLEKPAAEPVGRNRQP